MHLCVLVLGADLSRHYVCHMYATIYATYFSILLTLTEHRAHFPAVLPSEQHLRSHPTACWLLGDVWPWQDISDLNSAPVHQPTAHQPAWQKTMEKIAGAACKNDTAGGGAGDNTDSLSCISQGSDNGPCLKRTRRIDECSHDRPFATPNKLETRKHLCLSLLCAGFMVGKTQWETILHKNPQNMSIYLYMKLSACSGISFTTRFFF